MLDRYHTMFLVGVKGFFPQISQIFLKAGFFNRMDKIDKIYGVRVDGILWWRAVGRASGDGGHAFDASICAYPPCVRCDISISH